MEKLALILEEEENCYALTGAGISTASGIPDFRSPGTGLWEKTDPMKTSTLEVLERDPRFFYEAGFSRFARIADAEPNGGHFALARLEELGLIKGLVTQNIDGLHVKAGSQQVWEVHGHLRSGHCMGCGLGYPFRELVRQVEEKIIPPLCHNCSSVLRPDVVLFGDAMPSFFFDLQRLIEEDCRFMVVVGSSLAVYPVAHLPRLAERVAIINRDPTPYDQHAAVVIRDDISLALKGLLDLVGGQ